MSINRMFFLKKSSGILCPISSWPDENDIIGNFGKGAFQLADWLKSAGQEFIQILPLGPTGYSNSPFDGPSLLAGNPYFLNLDFLVDDGDLTKEQVSKYRSLLPKINKVDYGFLWNYKRPLLKEAGATFFSKASSERYHSFENFCSLNKEWLESYSLFMALKDLNGGRAWVEWKEFKKPLQKFKDYPGEVQDFAYIYQYLQWQFHLQWQKVVEIFHKKNIKIIGDMPVYCAYDSACVWANQQLFHLDEEGRSLWVAGVPPDYFSKTGQLWGNPLPRWHVLKNKEKILKSKYSEKPLELSISAKAEEVLKMVAGRFLKLMNQVDYVRIDHFRGLAGYGVIPAEDKTAERCRWVKGCGDRLLEFLKKKIDAQLPFIAEDLGVITPPVEKLRDSYSLPGMVIFQFASWSEKDFIKSRYFPENYTQKDVAYPGTHDNDTFLGWFEKLNSKSKKNVLNYLSSKSSERKIHWKMIEVLLNSSAGLVIFPIQDVLGLNSFARLNKPGSKSSENWTWRLLPDQLSENVAKKLYSLTKKAKRI